MKKILVVLFMLALIPTASMSAGLEFQFGATALYNNTVGYNSDYPETIGWDDFTFGLDARLSWGILQVSALVLITPGSAQYGWYYDQGGWYEDYYLEPTLIELYPGIGLKFDILFLSLGMTVGPNFLFKIYTTEAPSGSYNYYDTETYNMGFFMRPFIDFNIGRLTISVYYLYYLDFITYGEAWNAVENTEGYIGFSLMYKF